MAQDTLLIKSCSLRKHCICWKNVSSSVETSPSSLLGKPTKESSTRIQGFALHEVSCQSTSGNPPSPAGESIQASPFQDPLWQFAMSTSHKSLSECLKDLECKKGTLTIHPSIPYVPPIDLHEKRDTKQIKVKLTDGTNIQMSTLSTSLPSSISWSRSGLSKTLGKHLELSLKSGSNWNRSSMLPRTVRQKLKRTSRRGNSLQSRKNQSLPANLQGQRPWRPTSCSTALLLVRHKCNGTRLSKKWILMTPG